jgi:predicted PurR-regulated permease PerM
VRRLPPPAEHSPPASSGFELARRALPLIALCIGLILLVLLLWQIFDVILLAFAGILFAILLRTPADWLARHTRIPEGWALLIVVVLVVALLTGAGWLFGHSLSEQFAALVQRLPQMISKLRDRLADYSWLVGELEPSEWLKNQSGTLGRGISAAVATFGAVGNLIIVLFCGLFFAVQPRVYVSGMLQLVPLAQRARAGEVTRAVGDTLRRWLIGQLALMAIIGIAAGVGLGLLGVPLAFALGLITGLLEFIPYVGPIMSGILAMLVAFADTPELGLYVLALYLFIHTIEGYVLTPLIQQRAVYLPPAVLLLAQVILAVLVGVAGVMLATPVAATMLVLTRMLYLEDVLGQPAASHK